MIPSLFLEPGFLEGWVRHSRFKPRPHNYQLNTVWVCIDADHLQSFGEGFSLWKLNALGLHSLDRSRFLGSANESIRAAVERQLHNSGVNQPIGQILAIAAGKNMGFGRNPATFYLAHDENANLIAIIVNLTNQQHESYPYTFVVKDQHNLTFQSHKALYISGHTPMDVIYYWQFYIGKRHFMMNLRVEKQPDPQAPRVNSLLFPAKAKQDAIDKVLMEITMSSTQRHFSVKTAQSLGIKYAFLSLKLLISRFWTKLVLNENGFAEQHPSKTNQQHPQDIELPEQIRSMKKGR